MSKSARVVVGVVAIAVALAAAVAAALLEVPVGLLGVSAWVLPGLFVLAGVSVLRERGYGLVRGSCDAAFVVLVSGAASLMHDGWGGVLGDFVASLASGVIGSIASGATFVLFGMFAVVCRSLCASSVSRGGVKPKMAVEYRASHTEIAFPTLDAAVQAQAQAQVDATEEDKGDGEGEGDIAFSKTLPSLRVSVPVSASASVSAARPSLIGRFELPGVSMLKSATPGDSEPVSEETLREEASALEDALASYGVECKMESRVSGPTVATFEGRVSAGTKFGKVVGLSEDLGLALGRKVRVTAGSKPGRLAFEVSRGVRAAVGLRELCESPEFVNSRAALPIVLGRGMRGEAVVADIAEMPHAIVAGATGSGKSVALSTMLVSLLTRLGPDQLRLVLIDPKVVELQPYARVPHMLVPVVTDMGKAMSALRWAVAEMERRYRALAASGSKNLASFNAKAKPSDRLPHVVIVVDEFADFVATQGKAAEALVARLAQKARAAGIHMILATQRPSVDVITGTIKANFPTRIALRVAQKVDSRTILDEQGAEHLLGRGDMLVKLGGGAPVRVQCPMVSEEEIEAVCGALAAQGGPRYDESVFVEGEVDAEKEVVSPEGATPSKVWS